MHLQMEVAQKSNVDYFRGKWIEIGSTFTYFVKSGSVVKIAQSRLIATAQRRMSTIEAVISFLCTDCQFWQRPRDPLCLKARPERSEGGDEAFHTAPLSL
jgi:hypothetical protein